MKLQNFIVLFIIIILPVIIAMSYYMSMEINTINMQTAYNSKILQSTKESIEAFEINTVDWNIDYNQHGDSQRRDVMAAINTFTTSFANSIGLGGTNKENVLPYMPAIAFTLHDGYYIYSPSDVKETVKDENEVTLTVNPQTASNIEGYTYKESDKGKILYKADSHVIGTYNGENVTLDPQYASTTYKHILKPFSPYSKKYEISPIKSVIVNYSLDNYVRIYGNVGENEEFVSRAGYLASNVVKSAIFTSGTVQHGTIKYNDNGITNDIDPEELRENIAYYHADVNGIKLDETQRYYNVRYIYDVNNKTKVYIDDFTDPLNLTCFILEGERRINLTETGKYFKKVTVPVRESGNWTYVEVYQDMVEPNNWYIKQRNTEFTFANLNELPDDSRHDMGIRDELYYDYSGINYCVESYVFTVWAEGLGITDENGTLIFSRNEEDKGSSFDLERRQVIKDSLTTNLNQAITNYSNNSTNNYRLPVLTETDWDQILTNVSAITFVQGMPIGLKTYNNYAIATSTYNAEYVDPDGIFINAENDEFYHKPYCKKLEGKSEDNMRGYRNIDYIVKSFKEGENAQYFYRHALNPSYSGIEQAEQSCYYCMIQRDLYEKADDTSTSTISDVYVTALARERYITKSIKLPSQLDASYAIEVKLVNGNTKEQVYGKQWTYKIDGSTESQVTNDGTITIAKDYVEKQIEIKAVDPGTRIAGSGGTETGSLDYPEEVINEFLPVGALESLESSIKININSYTEDGLDFSITGLEDSRWGYGATENFNYEETKNNLYMDSYYVINGRIFVELHYYDAAEAVTSDIETWADIRSENDITIVSNLKNITGNIIIKYSADGASDVFSKPLYIENPNTKVYYHIPNSKTWYNKEWKAKVYSLSNTKISTNDGEVQFYTIKDIEGLKGFSIATNDLGEIDEEQKGARTLNRIFRVIRNINERGAIETISPINKNIAFDGSGNWFDGDFSGNWEANDSGDIVQKDNNNTIYNITIQTENRSDIGYGLFGGIGTHAKLSNINIDNINVSYNNKDKYAPVGGLVGFSDGQNYIKDVAVINSTVIGNTMVGGIAGNNKKTLENVTLSGGTVRSIGNNFGGTDGNSLTQTHLGGIVGKQEEGNIINATVENGAKIYGNSETDGYINVKNITNTSWIQGWLNGWLEDFPEGRIKDRLYDEDYDKRPKYFVGGIVGYTRSANEIVDSFIDENCKVVGGAIKDNGGTIDKEAEAYTGGFIGFMENGEFDGNEKNSKVYVYGYDNVAGIVGFSYKGKIKNITYSGTLEATNENSGGILACGNDAELEKCFNSGRINGEKNTGGIAGLASGGEIKNCGNNGIISGTGNTNKSPIPIIIEDTPDWIIDKLNESYDSIDSINAIMWYSMGGEEWSTGTGGIAGKSRRATIINCYNHNSVTCNYNGGGIVGLNYHGNVKRCYNTGNVSSTKANRIGGIIGAASYGSYVEYCYNKGTINGKTINSDRKGSSLYNGVGGIIGNITDNGWNIGIGSQRSKYLKIEFKFPKKTDYVSTIKYCYNIGKISVDGNSKREYTKVIGYWPFSHNPIYGPNMTVVQSYHLGGLIGTIQLHGQQAAILINPDRFEEGNVDLVLNDHNYFLDDAEYGAVSSWASLPPKLLDKTNNSRLRNFAKKNESELKTELNNMAGSVYITNTWDTSKGYGGYGVLNWQ